MITQPVLIDTGPIVAALDKSDEHHDTSVLQLRKIRNPLFTCWPVLTEAAWLLRKHLARVRSLLDACAGDPFEILSIGPQDLPAVNALLEKYDDQAIQLADACLLHLAERERIEHIFTLDRRDFDVYRTMAGKHLTLLPESFGV